MSNSKIILKEQKCPSCGKPMDHGYIAGHWIRLRWVKEAKTKTIFTGEPLSRKVDFWNAPVVEAVRCEDCKTGIFIYDS